MLDCVLAVRQSRLRRQRAGLTAGRSFLISHTRLGPTSTIEYAFFTHTLTFTRFDKDGTTD